MDRRITDLESITGPISVLFSRARVTDNLDVPAPNNMLFSKNNDITLVWNLSAVPAMESVVAFEKIRNLADSEFEAIDHDDIGIVTNTASITWHGDYPDVYFRVIMAREVIICPELTGNRFAGS